jgi:hypothetical protein
MEPLAGVGPAGSPYKGNLSRFEIGTAERQKNGGPPRYCPVFYGLKDRCITH